MLRLKGYTQVRFLLNTLDHSEPSTSNRFVSVKLKNIKEGKTDDFADSVNHHKAELTLSVFLTDDIPPIEIIKRIPCSSR